MGPADRRWRAAAEVFVYFNNDWEGFAVENATPLRRRLRRLQAVERASQQARHVHLRVADPLADLALGQVVHEAQLDHLALDVRQRLPGAGDRVAALDELVGRVLVAEQVDQRGRLVVLTRGRRVERRGLVARGGLLRLEHLLDACSRATPPPRGPWASGRGSWTAPRSRG